MEQYKIDKLVKFLDRCDHAYATGAQSKFLGWHKKMTYITCAVMTIVAVPVITFAVLSDIDLRDSISLVMFSTMLMPLGVLLLMWAESFCDKRAQQYHGDTRFADYRRFVKPSNYKIDGDEKKRNMVLKMLRSQHAPVSVLQRIMMGADRNYTVFFWRECFGILEDAQTAVSAKDEWENLIVETQNTIERNTPVQDARFKI